MKFQTEVELPTGFQGFISHTTPVVTLGSCFADEVGNRLRESLFDVMVNPFGPIFNPASIACTLNMVASGAYRLSDRIVERDGRWVSLDFHSRLSADTPEALVKQIDRQLAEVRDFISKASVVTLTLGTSRVFRHRRTDTVVANCHKLPASEFLELHLSPEEICSELMRCKNFLLRINPHVKIIITVSPVRHSGHSVHADRLSKSRLLLGADMFLTEPDTIYFPAYEIVTDQLRDYRFYAPDMMHPSAQAVDFVYERFADMFFSDLTSRVAADCRKITKRLAHRPLSGDIQEHNNRISELAATFTALHPEVQQPLERYLHSLSTTNTYA